MEIINKSSTNQKTHVCELPSTKTTNISTILGKKRRIPLLNDNQVHHQVHHQVVKHYRTNQSIYHGGWLNPFCKICSLCLLLAKI